VVFTKLIWRTMEVTGEVFHDLRVSVYGSLRVIATLEFLQHHLSKLGHRDLLVTHKISPSEPDGHSLYSRVASAARAASF
jgi:hypothetical protein